MTIKSIGIKNFRALEEVKLYTDGDCVIFIGNNGDGKTSILEAIYYCLTSSSFRAKENKYLIRKNKEGFNIKLNISEGERDYIIDSSYNGIEKKILINEKQISDRRELIYNFPCIPFISEDINFITGTPSEKWKFFDQVISLTDEEYLRSIKKYKGYITERNRLLKLTDKSLFYINDENIASTNIFIQKKRKEAVNKINRILEENYELFFEKENNIKIEYQQNIESDDKEVIMRVLYDNRDKDIERMATQRGVHRDEFIIRNGGDNYINYASKGQLRLLALLYRYAQIKYINEQTGKKPFVLIDDVFLELDKERRKVFFEKLEGYSELFLTFLPGENYYNNKDIKNVFYTINKGIISKLWKKTMYYFLTKKNPYFKIHRFW